MNVTGSVLQVVSFTQRNYAAASGTSASQLADLGLKVSITPKSSSSKFFVMINVGVGSTTTGNSWGGFLTRDNTVIGGGNSWSGSSFSGLLFRGPDTAGNGGGDQNHGAGASGSYLDTTSGTEGVSIEYACKFAGEGGAVHINHVEGLYNGSSFPVEAYTASTITVQEIAG
jgi:hypothetical protein